MKTSFNFRKAINKNEAHLGFKKTLKRLLLPSFLNNEEWVVVRLKLYKPE